MIIYIYPRSRNKEIDGLEIQMHWALERGDGDDGGDVDDNDNGYDDIDGNGDGGHGGWNGYDEDDIWKWEK